MAASDLTAQRLRELLNYNPDTGAFTRAVARSNVPAGSLAGCLNSVGYLVIRIDSRLYLSHRLAWLYMHGGWPEHHIDHINGNTRDNRIANLRDVKNSVNSQNQRSAKQSASNLLGAHKWHDKWTAGIMLNGKKTHLGVFSTPEEAHAAYIEAKRLMHPGCTI